MTEGSAFGLDIPTFEEVIVGELAQKAQWIVAEVKTNDPWSVTVQKVIYRDETIWIIPITTDRFPALAMRVLPGKDRDACGRLLMRFLSALAWVQRSGFRVDGFGGGSLPYVSVRNQRSSTSICDEFGLTYLPEPADEKALLALALMREGRSLNHAGYAFLSFYRVLEVALPDGKRRGTWISEHVDAVNGPRACEAIAALEAQGIADIGIHLRDSGRQAIAHAAQEPIIDPDELSDFQRLKDELPIMIDLAEMAIEEVLGVETRFTVYKKHLYELAGFKEIFGPDTVDRVSRGETITDNRLVDLPIITIRLRGRAAYAPLSNMLPDEIGHIDSEIVIRYKSVDRLITFQFKLNFPEERLLFDMFDDLLATDDGSACAAENIAEAERFRKEYFSNGRLEIYDASTGELISRKDAYLPMNMRMDDAIVEERVAYWRRLAEQRRDRDS